MSKEELIAFLHDNLELRVEMTSTYNGGMDDGPMYTTGHSIKLVMNGEVISEVSL